MTEVVKTSRESINRDINEPSDLLLPNAEHSSGIDVNKQRDNNNGSDTKDDSGRTVPSNTVADCTGDGTVIVPGTVRGVSSKSHRVCTATETSATTTRDTYSDTETRSLHIIDASRSALAQDADFNENFRQATEAILSGKHPILIPEGTSGSYFVQDKEGRYLAVFKPKDEEPFAPLNPKWPKFFQRVLCFCCFGRACLIPNNGYLSETAASLVDEAFGLNIVPKTRVVKLASPSFFYQRSFCGFAYSGEVWPKEGSYQLFVHGYESACKVLDRWEYDPKLLTGNEEKEFLILFQKMCVLDYVIRNTDRHKDNWLIRHVPGKEISLAAIDNGLAFPVKHPECASRFRQFPFGWAGLRWANEKWNPELRDHLLTLITPRFIHELCSNLRILLRHDLYNRTLTNNQLKVVRGQMYNLREALLKDLTPFEMSKMTPILLSRKYRREPKSDDIDECFAVRNMDYQGRVCF